MVYHDHDRIKSLGRREIRDEIHGNEGERAGIFRLERLQSRVRQVTIDFVLLTNSTTFDIILDECVLSWPPIVLSYNFLSL